MKELRFYGASDDLIEVEGDVPGADEYNGERAEFLIAGLVVTVTYEPSGCWQIAVCMEDEGVPVLAENVALRVCDAEARGLPEYAGWSPYSMLLSMDVPDGCELVYRGR